MRPTLGRALALLGVLISTGTLLTQFAVTMSLSQANGRTVLGSVIFFFSFFTILSNLLATFCFAAVAFPGCRHVAVFRSPKVVTAVALYMLVVAAVYIAILEGLWAPQGLMRVLDTLLHYVMPALFLIFWGAFVPKGATAYADIPSFLAFPVIYGAYVMIRGALTGDYPYPILNAETLGYPVALANMAAILALFLILGLAFIACDRWAGKRDGTASSR